MLRSLAASATAIFLLAPTLGQAEEGGSGHYLPGSMASFIDAVPASDTFLARLNVIYYHGSVDAQQPLPIAGLDTVGAHAQSWGLGLTLLWRPSWGDLGHGWSYAMSTTIPFLDMDVGARVNAVPGSISRSSSTDGLGDVVLMPLMLNYNVNPDFNVNFRVGFYAPSGSYEDGRLANTGKNFWTTEPTIAFMYLGQKNGIEASLFVGADFNAENDATHYKSGTQAHIDGTLAQHFPLAGGLAGVGLSAYYYQQISGDSGSGANLGSFEAKTVGIGPVLSYVGKLGGMDTVYELKWLHETDTEKRLEGDIGWFKAVFKF